MRFRQLVLSTLGLVLLPALANAQFSEDFDSYATGTSMHGVNGWKGWDNNPAFTAYTSDVQSVSSPNSVAIGPTSDLVHEFSGYTSGSWIFTAWQYIPGTSTGLQYLILLNTYTDGGPYNWSTEIQFSNGLVTNDGDLATLPMITDQWVEIRVEINLDTDVQTIYYGGTFLTQTSWTAGLSGGGALNIGALDLYSNAGSEIYYDDITLVRDQPSPTIETSWGGIKAAFKN